MDDRVREAQEICARVAGTLLGIEDELRRTLESLPESPERDRMEEGMMAPDVATDVRGALECVLADDLRPAIQTMHSAASVTDASLEREWRARRKFRQ